MSDFGTFGYTPTTGGASHISPFTSGAGSTFTVQPGQTFVGVSPEADAQHFLNALNGGGSASAAPDSPAAQDPTPDPWQGSWDLPGVGKGNVQLGDTPPKAGPSPLLIGGGIVGALLLAYLLVRK